VPGSWWDSDGEQATINLPIENVCCNIPIYDRKIPFRFVFNCSSEDDRNIVTAGL
jgi:hypothetical protein